MMLTGEYRTTPKGRDHTLFQNATGDTGIGQAEVGTA